MAAKQIIVLETNPGDGGNVSIRVAFWFPVTVGHEVVNNSLVSAWKGANSTEETALQAGTVLEEVHTISVPNTYTTAQIKTFLQATYTTRSSYLASLPNQGQFYGVFFDGTVWSA